MDTPKISCGRRNILKRPTTLNEGSWISFCFPAVPHAGTYWYGPFTDQAYIKMYCQVCPDRNHGMCTFARLPSIPNLRCSKKACHAATRNHNGTKVTVPGAQRHRSASKSTCWEAWWKILNATLHKTALELEFIVSLKWNLVFPHLELICTASSASFLNPKVMTVSGCSQDNHDTSA